MPFGSLECGCESMGVPVSPRAMMSMNLKWLQVSLSLCHSMLSGCGLRLWVMMSVKTKSLHVAVCDYHGRGLSMFSLCVFISVSMYSVYVAVSVHAVLCLWPWQGSSVGWSTVSILQGCGFSPWLGHIQEATMNTWMGGTTTTKNRCCFSLSLSLLNKF